MRAFGHISVAMLAAKLLVHNIELNGIVLVVLLSLLPDIDHPNSLLGKIRHISNFIYIKFGHRTFTHSFVFAVLVTNFFAFNSSFYKLAWISVGSHLFADMLTYTGIPLFWPYNKNFVVFNGPLLTGSWQETVLALICCAGVVMCFVWM